jgi:hypothetical protein
MSVHDRWHEAIDRFEFLQAGDVWLFPRKPGQ